MAQKGKRVQGVLESQTAALLRHQKEEETDKSKQAHLILNVPVLYIKLVGTIKLQNSNPIS